MYDLEGEKSQPAVFIFIHIIYPKLVCYPIIFIIMCKFHFLYMVQLSFLINIC